MKSCFIIVCCGLMSLILGCATDARVSRLDDPDAIPEHQLDLLDSEVFDWKLGLSLRRHLAEVEVKVIEPFSANNVPERIEVWLSAVDEHGGTVELKPDPAIPTRSIILDVIDLVIVAYERVKKATLYDATADYNATVYYVPGSGVITRIVFALKETENITS